MTEIPDSFYSTGAMAALDAERVLCAWGDVTRSPEPPSERPAFFCPDFFLEDRTPWVSFPSYQIKNRDSLPKSSCPPVSPVNWTQPPLQRFEEQFQRARRSFESGELEKTVPVVFERAEATFDEARRRALVTNAILSPKDLYPYGIWSSAEGIIGATPEILVRVDGDGDALCVALAGTRDDKGAFLEKERHEHQLVVDYLIKELSAFGEPDCGPTTELNLPGLTHLKTIVRVPLGKGADVAALIKKLHPTPALGGSPKEAAVKFLREEARHEARLRFGAPFAVRFPDGTGTALVAIRNIQWKDGKVLLGAGCGVVQESILENEWNELRLKRETVHKILGV